MNNKELEATINSLLSSNEIKEYCPNGLQVEGKQDVYKLAIAVSANLFTIEAAVKLKADALLTHHGFFWKNENQKIVDAKKRCFTQLLKNDINLYSYHLPLDIHAEYGNNAQIAKLLNIQNVEYLNGEKIGMCGYLPKVTTIQALMIEIQKYFRIQNNVMLSCNDKVHKLAFVSGAGQGYLQDAIKSSCDTFITGEASLQNYSESIESNINFIACGHYHTEQYGVKALGRYISEQHNIEVCFIDENCPI